jgi:hypothetical protein
VIAPDDGLGAVILQNGGGEKTQVTFHALEVVRAALAGRGLPDVWAPPAPTSIPKAADYAGTYAGDDGRTMVVGAADDGLELAVGPVTVRLERDPLSTESSDEFLVPHPALDRFLLSFGRDESGAVVEAFHGSTWFRGERYAGPEPDALTQALEGLIGVYRNDDPWGPVFRILAQKGRLVQQWPHGSGDEGADAPLLALDDGSFAVGEERDPRRLRFHGDADGKAMVAEFNGGRWYRSFEE